MQEVKTVCLIVQRTTANIKRTSNLFTQIYDTHEQMTASKIRNSIVRIIKFKLRYHQVERFEGSEGNDRYNFFLLCHSNRILKPVRMKTKPIANSNMRK